MKGKKHSDETKRKMSIAMLESPSEKRLSYWDRMKGLKNEKSNNWKEEVGYSGNHQWMNANYGKPLECESTSCTHKSKVFEWCLKKGYKHSKDKEAYIRMCRSCHRKYDLTIEKREKAIDNLIKFNPYAKKDSYKRMVV